MLFVGLIGYYLHHTGKLSTSREERVFLANIKGWMRRGGEERELKTLTDFQWDRRCAVGPYGGFPADFFGDGVREYHRWYNEEGIWTLGFITSDGRRLFLGIERQISDFESRKAGCFGPDVRVVLFLAKINWGRDGRRFLRFLDVDEP